MRGQPIQREDGGVGEIGHTAKTGDGGKGGRRAGGDDEAAGADLVSARDHGVAVCKARLGPEHGAAEGSEPFLGIAGRDRRDGAAHMGHDGGEVDGRLARPDPEGGAITGGLGMAGRRKQRLGGYAAGIQALAAHGGALDENDTAAETGRGGCEGKSPRSRADDADVARQAVHRTFGARRPKRASVV